MPAGKRLAIALGMLGACRLACGAATEAAPDAVAAQVQVVLHAHYAKPGKLMLLDHVLTLEQRLGAYRAAQTREELIRRLNADLWVVTRDRQISVHEQFEPTGPCPRRYPIGWGLVLCMSEGS